MGKHKTREKAHDGLKNTTGPCRGKGEFKGSPRQVYGGQGCKFNTESSSHLICSKRGVMNLPFRNASAIKHCREEVQPGWLGRGAAPPSHPRFRGHAGWGEGLSCYGRARRGCRTISSPAVHLQPRIPLLQACPLGTKPAQPCAQQESGGLAPNASGQLLRGSEPPLSWTHFPKSLQPAHYWRLITHLRRQARAPAQPRSAGSKDLLPSLPQLSAPFSAGDSQQKQGSTAEAQP